MNQDQKIVAIGAGSGVITMAVSLTLLYYALPTIPGMETVIESN